MSAEKRFCGFSTSSRLNVNCRFGKRSYKRNLMLDNKKERPLDFE